jgi:hypothetical protein
VDAKLDVPSFRLSRFQSTSSELTSLLADHVSGALWSQLSKVILHTLSRSVTGLFLGRRNSNWQPARRPRYFSPTGLITAYDPTLSLLQESLRKHEIQEAITGAFYLRGQSIMLLTALNILVVTLDGRSIVWKSPRRAIQHVSSNEQGELLLLALSREPFSVTLKDVAAVPEFVNLFSTASSQDSQGSSSSSNFNSIASVRVHSQKYVDKITLIYRDRTARGFGGNGGQPQQFYLKQNERIVKIICHVGPTRGEDVMKQITFETSHGHRLGPYGEQTTASRPVTYSPPPGMPNPGLVDLELELATFTILLNQKCLGPKLTPFWLPFPE